MASKQELLKEILLILYNKGPDDKTGVAELCEAIADSSREEVINVLEQLEGLNFVKRTGLDRETFLCWITPDGRQMVREFTKPEVSPEKPKTEPVTINHEKPEVTPPEHYPEFSWSLLKKLHQNHFPKVQRQDVIDQIKKTLKDSTERNVIFLHGPPKVGKTFVLERLQEALQDQYIPVFINFNGWASIQNQLDFLEELAEKIQFEIESLIPGVQIDPFNPVSEAQATREFTRFMHKLSQNIHTAEKERVHELEEDSGIERAGRENESVSFSSKVKRIERLFDVGEYTIVAKECVGLIEQALRHLFSQTLTQLDEKDRLKVQEAEQNIGKGEKGIESFTMGQLVGLFRTSRFLEAWARASGRDLSSIRVINLNELTTFRNKFIHGDVEATRAEAEFLFNCLHVILETFEIVSLESHDSPSPSKRKLKAPVPQRLDVSTRKLFLLIFDELDYLQRFETDRRIFEYLGGLIERSSRQARFIFAGSGDIFDLLEHNELVSLLADGRRICVDCFVEQISRDVIAALTSPYFRLTSEALEQIIYLADGHPTLLKEVLGIIVHFWQSDHQKKVIDAEDIDFVLEDIRVELSPKLKDIWLRLSLPEQRIMQQIAQSTNGRSRVREISIEQMSYAHPDLKKLVRRRILGYTALEAQYTVRLGLLVDLIEYGILS